MCFHNCFLTIVGRWSATGKALVVRSSTIHPWTMAVSVQRLTLLRGWNPRLLTRSPSRPRAARHTCGAHTRTHTWRQSPCSDSRERSALRCDDVDTIPPPCTSDQICTRLRLCNRNTLYQTLEACFFLMSTSASPEHVSLSSL